MFKKWLFGLLLSAGLVSGCATSNDLTSRDPACQADAQNSDVSCKSNNKSMSPERHFGHDR